MQRNEKKKLRSIAKKLRNAIPIESRQLKDEAIFQRITGLCEDPAFARMLPEPLSESSYLTSYYSFGSEVDTSCINVWIADRYQLLLPRVIDDGKATEMVFVPCHPNNQDDFHRSSFGILEPVGPHIDDDILISIVFLPALAYDLKGVRLGYGGGYYDRFFEKRNKTQSSRPVYVGVAYSDQLVDSLPCEPHDLTVDAIVTEKEVFRISF